MHSVYNLSKVYKYFGGIVKLLNQQKENIILPLEAWGFVKISDQLSMTNRSESLKNNLLSGKINFLKEKSTSCYSREGIDQLFL